MAEVTGVEIDGVEYVNPQVGNTLFRDGGPYGDQADAIRDEKVNAAREGREPNFDNLIPTQYKLITKEEAKRRDYAVGSQTHIFETEEPTEESQSDSEDVARALGVGEENDPFKDL